MTLKWQHVIDTLGFIILSGFLCIYLELSIIEKKSLCQEQKKVWPEARKGLCGMRSHTVKGQHGKWTKSWGGSLLSPAHCLSNLILHVTFFVWGEKDGLINLILFH